MAKKKPTISIIVALRDKPAVEGIKALTSNFLGFAKDVDPAVRLVSNTVRGLTTVVTIATAAMQASTAQAIEYDKALRGVTTIADEAAFPLDRVRAISFDIANLYGSDVTTNARTLYEVISAGVTDAAAATETLYVANKVAIGGMASTQSAVAGLTGIINAFAAQQVTATEAADAMFVAAAAGATTIEQLADSLGMVSPIASNVGLTIDETAGAVAVLTANGIKTSTAAEYLRSALQNIIKPSEQAQGVAKQLGIAFNAEALAAEGLSKFLQRVVNDSGATKEQLGRLFGDIGGLTAAMALAVNDGAKLNDTLEDMRTKAGAADKAFDTMSKTLGFQVQRYHALSDAASTALGGAVTESETARKGLEAVNTALVQVTAYFDSPEGRQAVNQFFDLILQYAAAAIRAMGRLAEAITAPATALEKAWARLSGDPFVEPLESASTLLGIAEELAGTLEKIAARKGSLVINEDGGERDPQALAAPFGFTPRFEPFRPFVGPRQPRPTAAASTDGDSKETEAEKAAREERARARAQDAEGMAAVMEDERRDAQLLNEILLEDQLAAYNARLEAEREFAKQMQEAIRERGRQTEEEERSANRAQVDAANEGLQDLMEYTRDATDQLQGIKDLFADGPITPEEADVITKTASLISGVFSSMFMEIGEAIGSGNLDGALEALGGFFGNMLKTMGSAAIQLGSLLGVLGIVGLILGIAPLAAALPYAGALIVAGVAAVAAGTALGASGGGSASSASGGGGAGRSTERDSGPSDMKIRNLPAYDDGATQSASGVPRRGVASAAEGTRQIVIEEHVHFDRGMVVASSGAEAGRQIEEWRSDAARLRGERDPWRR